MFSTHEVVHMSKCSKEGHRRVSSINVIQTFINNHRTSTAHPIGQQPFQKLVITYPKCVCCRGEEKILDQQGLHKIC